MMQEMCVQPESTAHALQSLPAFAFNFELYLDRKIHPDSFSAIKSFTYRHLAEFASI